MEAVVQGLMWLAQQPAVQGVVVAAATEGIKRAPVGPSGGPKIRFVAAVLALASSFAAAAAAGDVAAVNAEEVGNHVVEALGAFLAAVGAWQLSRKADGRNS